MRTRRTVKRPDLFVAEASTQDSAKRRKAMAGAQPLAPEACTSRAARHAQDSMSQDLVGLKLTTINGHRGVISSVGPGHKYTIRYPGNVYEVNTDEVMLRATVDHDQRGGIDGNTVGFDWKDPRSSLLASLHSSKSAANAIRKWRPASAVAPPVVENFQRVSLYIY